MVRICLFAVAALHAGTAVFIFVAPAAWYEATPGVSATGPLNTHFARDVGLAFAASSLGLALGARSGAAETALIGAAWPAFHAVFHIWIWFHRGLQTDVVAAVNLFGIQAPAWLALWAALSLRAREVEGTS